MEYLSRSIFGAEPDIENPKHPNRNCKSKYHTFDKKFNKKHSPKWQKYRILPISVSRISPQISVANGKNKRLIVKIIMSGIGISGKINTQAAQRQIPKI